MYTEKTGSAKIHFLIGPGRSGTTMLMHMLNVHPECISTPEIKHLLYFFDKYKSITVVTPALIKDVRNFLTIITRRNSILHLLDPEKMMSDLHLIESNPIDYITLSKKIYFLFGYTKADFSAVTTIIDKNPIYTLKIEKIKSFLPDSKFLCLVRDYRAYVLSNVQTPDNLSGRSSALLYHSLVWRFYAREILKQKKQDSSNSIAIIQYEELVKEKEKTFAEVCNFFSLPYDENCFDFNKVILAAVEGTNVSETDAKLRAKLENLSKPVNMLRVDSWKNAFTKGQLKKIEFWCADNGKEFGYLPMEKISFNEKIMFSLMSIIPFIRVWLFFQLRSIKIAFYLNDKKRAGHFTKHSNWQ